MTKPHIDARTLDSKRALSVYLDLQASPLQCARHSGVRLDILALGEGRPQRPDEGALLAAVQVAKQGLDGFCGLLGIIEGDSPI